MSQDERVARAWDAYIKDLAAEKAAEEAYDRAVEAEQAAFKVYMEAIDKARGA